MINEIVGQASLTEVLVVLPNHPVIISTFHISTFPYWNKNTQQLAKPPHRSPDMESCLFW